LLLKEAKIRLALNAVFSFHWTHADMARVIYFSVALVLLK
jgi:hypothetical protein